MKNLSDQEIVRRQKKQQLEERGIYPYPSATFETNTTPKHILKYYNDENNEAYQSIAIAGRIMSIRIMGAASFLELQHENTKIQVYVNQDSICANNEDADFYKTVFKKLIDIGDFIGVNGYVFRTKVGALCIHAQKLKLLSKALKQIPVVKETGDGGEKKIHDEFVSTEARYRQRYLDLILNENVNKVFRKRAKLFSSLRKTLNSHGYLEVETPMLQSMHGGALAKPFTTHHNSLDMDLYLRIAPELYLKRLIIGGFSGVYEIGKSFRNEGMSRFHNPEFTSLELYVAYKDYRWMMKCTEEIIAQAAIDTTGSEVVSVGEHSISFAPPWQRYTFYGAIEKFTGTDISKMCLRELKNFASDMKIEVPLKANESKIKDEIFSSKCEPFIIQPTFITDLPIDMSPLAKAHARKPELAERFEVFCNGKEIANAYSELNDPIDQRIRLEKQLDAAQAGDDEAMALDEDFICALEYGMPPTAGLGIGLDRLAMIFSDSASIQDVIFFPQMRKKKN